MTEKADNARAGSGTSPASSSGRGTARGGESASDAASSALADTQSGGLEGAVQRSGMGLGYGVSRVDITARILRGVIGHFHALGWSVLPEFTLPTGRRVDVMALSTKGQFWAIEIKSCLDDFRVDQKWQEYLGFCDRFSFAVDPDFPLPQLPEDVGVILADNFEAFELRPPKMADPLPAARRRSLLMKYATNAADRLVRERSMI